jgi:hypothetical protein
VNAFIGGIPNDSPAAVAFAETLAAFRISTTLQYKALKDAKRQAFEEAWTTGMVRIAKDRGVWPEQGEGETLAEMYERVRKAQKPWVSKYAHHQAKPKAPPISPEERARRRAARELVEQQKRAARFREERRLEQVRLAHERTLARIQANGGETATTRVKAWKQKRKARRAA